MNYKIIRKIIIYTMVLTLILSNTLLAKEEKQSKLDMELEIITIEEYNEMDKKEQSKYLDKYAKTIEKEINRQVKENQKNMLNEYQAKGYGANEVLEKFFKEYEVVLDISDEIVRDKLVKSLGHPTSYSQVIDINSMIDETSMSNDDDNIMSSVVASSSGQYLEQYKNDYIWYSGRTITISLYQKTWTTQAYFNGDYYTTYDISEFIYSWTGSSTTNDRIESIECSVTQADGRTGSVNTRVYNTGWPEHYYSGSFSKNSSALNLPTGCIIESSGACGVGIESKASFDGYINYRIIQSGYGALNY